MTPRDREADFQCADCGAEPARLRTVDGRLVCDPECRRPNPDTGRGHGDPPASEAGPSLEATGGAMT